MSESNTQISIDYFQIGAHIGKTDNDHIFNNNCINKSIILIEPVPYLFDQLKINYTDKINTNTITFLNIAVSNNDGNLNLFVPSINNDFTKYPSWASQLASTNEVHIKTHIPNLLVDKITVPCYKLNTLIRTMNISHIENLLVDTEGHDYDILMDLDLNILKPITIRFEHKHMDGVFTRAGKYLILIDHFFKHGYKMVYENFEDIVISLNHNLTIQPHRQ
jgi:FkbM family methyltransferase